MGMYLSTLHQNFSMGSQEDITFHLHVAPKLNLPRKRHTHLHACNTTHKSYPDEHREHAINPGVHSQAAAP